MRDGLPDGRHARRHGAQLAAGLDALQVGGRVLWEIKTDEFGRYNEFLKKQVVADELVEFEEESRIALACGYDFTVGVSTEEHKAALILREAI